MAQAPALPRGFELPLEPRLPRDRLGRPGRRSRSAPPRSRSARSRRTSKLWALELAVRMMDLTTLEGADTPGKVAALCVEGARARPVRPHGAARRRRLRLPEPRAARASSGSRARASRSPPSRPAFPSGQSPLDVKLADARAAVELGADEIDMVIDRGAFLSGRYAKVYDEIVAGEGGVRRRAPEGDPRDRRARHLRQRPPRVAARDRGRRRLHQDLDRQGLSRPPRCR